MNQYVNLKHTLIMTINEAGERHPLRFGPDGASIGSEIPESLLILWKGMLANCAKAQHRLHASYERQFKDQEACVRVMRGLVGEASSIGDDRNDLAGLFDMALNSDGVDGKLAEAIRLVVGFIKTMADRLYALEEQSDAAHARYFQ